MTHATRAECLVCGLPVGTYPARCFACAAALERARGSAWYGWRQLARVAADVMHEAAQASHERRPPTAHEGGAR
jgi:hypothetical protein